MTYDPETQFGFKKISSSDKLSQVFGVFKSVANKYDLMNNLMSFGVHHYWKNELINMVNPKPNMSILDVAGGTGDIAIKLIKACAHYTSLPQVTVYDQNPNMLEEGKAKAYNQGIFSELEWIEGDAADLPFADNHFDCLTISFGLRNVTYMDKALREFLRVLKPGGSFYCLEFSKLQEPLLKKLYDLYSFQVIPRIGALVANDKEAYQYLIESIAQFPDQESLLTILNDAGFIQTGYRNLTQGVVAIHSGKKPS